MIEHPAGGTQLEQAPKVEQVGGRGGKGQRFVMLLEKAGKGAREAAELGARLCRGE